MPERHAFIDTSIFLHYRLFDEVDWPAVLDAESVCLVLAPIAVSELNEKKDEPTPKLRQRAATVLKKLEALWSAGNPVEVRPGVRLFFQEVEPAIDYAAHQLDYRSQDDRLLAAILQFREATSGTNCLLVTGDFGLRVKARRHGIDTTGLPDNLKLAEEPDANEKRIQQLERELQELKRAIPRLELAFHGGEQRHMAKLARPVVPSRDDIEREKKLVRLKHKKMGDEPEAPPPAEHPLSAMARFGAQFSRPSPEAVARYNAELDRFYTKYDRWLETRHVHTNRERLTVPLAFMLSNAGTAPAEDIDVFFHFPDGFSLLSERNLPVAPDEPAPPERPVGGLPGLAGLSIPSLPSALHSLSALQPPGPRNVSSPSIERTNSYDVNIHVRNLKHQLVEDLGTLYVVYGSFEEASSFSIEFRLVAANVPKPVEGKLRVVVQKEAQTARQES